MRKLLAALVLSLFCLTPSYAAPETMPELFKVAIQLGGYEDSCRWREPKCLPPAVIIQELPDGIRGQFTWLAPSAVAISEAYVPGDPHWSATIVHEFVHYLQWLHGELGPTVTCFGAMNAEFEAYAVGSIYLRRFGIEEDFAIQRFYVAMMCMGE